MQKLIILAVLFSTFIASYETSPVIKVSCNHKTGKCQDRYLVIRSLPDVASTAANASPQMFNPSRVTRSDPLGLAHPNWQDQDTNNNHINAQSESQENSFGINVKSHSGGDSVLQHREPAANDQVKHIMKRETSDFEDEALDYKSEDPSYEQIYSNYDKDMSTSSSTSSHQYHAGLGWLAMDMQNKLVATTVGAVLIVYAIFCLLSVMWHRQNTHQNMVHMFPGEYVSETSRPYLVTVVTGSRQGAGAYSGSVRMAIHGRKSTSEEHLVDVTECQDERTFKRGCRNKFFLHSKESLGNLKLVDIELISDYQPVKWFLSYVTVVDLASRTQWYFPCHKWLQSHKCNSDRRVLIPGTDSNARLLMANIWRGLNQYHLWLSPWTSGELANNFRRIMSITLVLTIVTTCMFSNVVVFYMPALRPTSLSLTELLFPTWLIAANMMACGLNIIFQAVVSSLQLITSKETLVQSMLVFHNFQKGFQAGQVSYNQPIPDEDLYYQNNDLRQQDAGSEAVYPEYTRSCPSNGSILTTISECDSIVSDDEIDNRADCESPKTTTDVGTMCSLDSVVAEKSPDVGKVFLHRVQSALHDQEVTLNVSSASESKNKSFNDKAVQFSEVDEKLHDGIVRVLNSLANEGSIPDDNLDSILKRLTSTGELRDLPPLELSALESKTDLRELFKGMPNHKDAAFSRVQSSLERLSSLNLFDKSFEKKNSGSEFYGHSTSSSCDLLDSNSTKTVPCKLLKQLSDDSHFAIRNHTDSLHLTKEREVRKPDKERTMLSTDESDIYQLCPYHESTSSLSLNKGASYSKIKEPTSDIRKKWDNLWVQMKPNVGELHSGQTDKRGEFQSKRKTPQSSNYSELNVFPASRSSAVLNFAKDIVSQAISDGKHLYAKEANGSDKQSETSERYMEDDVFTFVRAASNEKLSAAVTLASTSSNIGKSKHKLESGHNFSKRLSDSTLYKVKSNPDIGTGRSSDTSIIRLLKTASGASVNDVGESTTSIFGIQKTNKLGQVAKHISFNITSGALENSLTTLDEWAEEKSTEIIEKSKLLVQVLLKNKASSTSSQTSLKDSPMMKIVAPLAKRRSSHILKTVSSEYASKMSNENVLKVAKASVDNVTSDEIVDKVQEAVLDYSDGNIQEFASEVVSSLYGVVRGRLNEAVASYVASNSANHVDLSELMNNAEEELKTKVLPSLVEHVAFLLEEQAESVKEFDLDMMMLVYAGQYVETIVTNAVLRTHIDINKELNSLKGNENKSKNNNKSTDMFSKLGLSMEEKGDWWWKLWLPSGLKKNVGNTNNNSDPEPVAKMVPKMTYGVEQAEIIERLLAMMHNNLSEMSASDLGKRPDVTEKVCCVMCKGKAIKEVTSKILGKASSKYLVYQVLKKANKHLQLCCELLDEKKKEIGDSDILMEVGRHLLNGTASTEHMSIIQSVTDDLRRTTLEKALTEVANDVLNETVTLDNDKDLQEMLQKFYKEAGQKTEEIILKKLVAKQRATKGMETLHNGDMTERFVDASDKMRWEENVNANAGNHESNTELSAGKSDLINEFQEIRSMLVSSLENVVDHSSHNESDPAGDRTFMSYYSPVREVSHGSSQTPVQNINYEPESYNPGRCTEEHIESGQHFQQGTDDDVEPVGYSDDEAINFTVPKLRDESTLDNRIGLFISDYLKDRCLPPVTGYVLFVLFVAITLACVIATVMLGSTMPQPHAHGWFVICLTALLANMFILEPLKVTMVALYWTIKRKTVMF